MSQLPALGSKAPDFSLSDEAGQKHTLAQYSGQWVLLYFYPKDDTPGCTTEACGFRDFRYKLQDEGVEVIGISKDSVKSHKKFAEKYKLPFPLLSDEDKTICEAFGVWGKKKFMGREYNGVFRTSFLVDKDGKIAKIYENVKPADHVSEVLKDFNALV
jgi:peroxiredoxin Q/BCP